MNIFLIVALGLPGLGLVILVHELGHFLAARAVGIEVETFSLGWGPRVAGFKRGGTDYRISAFPIGGYCLMRGETEFRAALEKRSDEIPRVPGTFYGASPWRRILVSLAGPLANVLLAALLFMAVAGMGFDLQTRGNRIVLASEFSTDSGTRASAFPADLAGLKSGDAVVEIEGRKVSDFYDLQDAINAASPGARIGVYPWVDPLVSAVQAGSSAELAGVLPGDLLVSLGGKPVRHMMELFYLLRDKPERATLGLRRGSENLELPLVLSWQANGESNLGLAFRSITHHERPSSLASTLPAGIERTYSTFALTLRSLGTLVSRNGGAALHVKALRDGATLSFEVKPSMAGVTFTDSFSGPARITWMIGTIANQGIGEGGPSGLSKFLDILAFLSIGLFIMNLLPIPALDGGQILLFLVESARRKPLKTRTVYRFQVIGAFIVLAIFLLAMASDLIFFSK